MKHIVWSSFPCFDDWKDDLMEEFPDEDEDFLYDEMYRINDNYLDDERVNLNINVGDAIIVIADLGLWFGHRVAYKEIESGNIADCLYSDYSPEWYVEDGDFKCADHHHDGTNYYRYRAFRENIDLDEREDFLDSLYNGAITDEDIEKVTKSLAPYIEKVYGWQ